MEVEISGIISIPYYEKKHILEKTGTSICSSYSPGSIGRGGHFTNFFPQKMAQFPFITTPKGKNLPPPPTLGNFLKTSTPLSLHPHPLLIDRGVYLC